MVKNGKLRTKKLIERFSYGCGDFGCNIIYTAMSMFLLFYYSDYAGVNIAAVGTIMFISRLFDGVSDIIMGYIVDKTKSKYGKARPWILRLCIPFAISGVLLFSVPPSWGNTSKLVYIFITYNLVSTIIYTAINVPYSALNALMTQDPYERSVLSIYRNLLATAGTLIINTFTLPLVEYFGNNSTAWIKSFSIFGLLSIVAFLINFYGTKERVKPSINKETGKINEVNFKDGIKAIFSNKYWIMITIFLALTFMVFSINGGATIYYAKDILGNSNLVGVINSVMNIAQIAMMILVAPFIKKFGKKNILSGGLVLSILGVLILNYSSGIISLVIFSSLVRGLASACIGATMWAMVSDTIDYGEWKTGYRTEGLINSACSFGFKIGSGLGSAILGWILAFGGYSGELAIQSQTAIFSIKVCVIWIPLIIYIISLIMMSFYKLDKEFISIIEDLKNRNFNGNKIVMK